MVSKRTANLKHAQHYGNVLLRADRMYEAGTSGIEDGLRLFDGNWKNIELGQKWAVSRIDMDDDAAGLASEYPERGARCLYLRQKPIERIKWLEAALRVAHSRGFELLEGTLHGKIGLAQAERGDHQKAIAHYSVRLEIAKKFNDMEGLGEGICNLGISYDSLNMIENAQECYEFALELADKIANQKIIEVATGNLGLVYLKKGQFDAALDCFQKHLQLAQQNGDLWSESNALTNKGIASLKMQNYKQALQCFQDSISINKKLDDSEGEAKNLSYIGSTFAATGDLDEAASAYQARILVALNLQDAHGHAIGSWNLGEILIKQKKYKLGLEYLKQCVEYEKTVGDPSWEEDFKLIQELEARYGQKEM